MPEPVEGAQRYMPGLDGLRALAVLAVVAYHLEFGWAQGGLLGVGVFFTLSGYLITDLLLEQRESLGRLRLANFWIRRARRLLPAVFLMLAVVVAWVTLMDPSRMADLRGDVAAAALYVSNWWNIFENASYFAQYGPPSPLQHLWSLAIEEQFYLLWPFLLWLGLRYVRGRYWLTGLTLATAAASAALMWGLYQPGSDPTRVYEGTDTRAFGLLVGAALAMVWPSRHLLAERLTSGRRPWRRWLLEGVGVLGLVVTAFLIWQTDQYSSFLYHGGLVALTVATALVVAALAHPASRLGPALGWGPLRWVGVRSYGIYIWHFPIIVLTAPNYTREGVSLSLGALQVGATIVVAALSWRFVEEPIRRGALGRLWGQLRSGQWRRSLPRRGDARRRWRRIAAGGMVSMVALGVLAVGAAGLAGVSPAPGGLLSTAGSATETGESVSGGGNSPAPSPEEAPAATEPSPELSPEPSAQASKPSTNPEPTAAAPSTDSQAQDSSSPEEAGSATRTSCESVVYIGDSSSRGLTSPDYLPDPDTRLDARFAQVGATSSRIEIQAARSVVESLYASQDNGEELAQRLVSQGFDGCWVIALGNMDTASVYRGSPVGRSDRIERMMSAIGEQPVMWLTTKTLTETEPYSNTNMQLWDRTLTEACKKHPNLTVFDWASVVEDGWYEPDGIHYSPEGNAYRARLIAEALTHAYPASGKKEGSSCVVQ